MGGDDIDTAIVRYWLSSSFCHPDPSQDLEKHLKILDADYRQHDKTKELNVLAQYAKIAKEYLTKYETWGDKKQDLSLTRTDLKGIIKPILQKTFDYFRQSLKDAGLDTVDQIILVGGASQTYGLKDALEKEFRYDLSSLRKQGSQYRCSHRGSHTSA